MYKFGLPGYMSKQLEHFEAEMCQAMYKEVTCQLSFRETHIFWT